MKEDPVLRVPPYLNNKVQGVIYRIVRSTLTLKKISKTLGSSEIDAVIKDLEYASDRIVDISRRISSFVWKLKGRNPRKAL